MKRLATATVLLTALAAGAQAGSLPKPIRLVERFKMYSPTHYIRGDQGGSRGWGSYESSTEEARKQAPVPKPTEKQKPEPKPARAD